jgi:hypothetical protein
LLYVKGQSLPELTGELAHALRLPPEVRHAWVVDRGLLSRPLLRSCARHRQFVLGRARCNQVVYFAPRRQKRGRGRRRTYGAKCRVDKLLARFPERLRHRRMGLHVQGREREARVADALVLLRGVERGRPLAARVIVVVVERSKLRPWYLLTTDLTLGVEEAVRAYVGRQQIEVNFDEVKELGLGHYMGRSGQGVRRWPLFLCAAQMALKFMATGIIAVPLPKLNWSWYKQEDTVGQMRRRLVESCRPRISRVVAAIPDLREIKKAA